VTVIQTEITDDVEFSRMGIRLEICHTTDIDQWITERHYLHSVPCGARVRMAFKNREGELLGAMMWCRPEARKLEQWELLSLARMVFVGNTAPFVESHCLSLARKHIRKHLPDIKGLVTYTSKGFNHEGTVYKADGWYQLGIVKAPPSWETRENRTDRDRSDKVRWTRSP
jgi:hypothetical protein